MVNNKTVKKSGVSEDSTLNEFLQIRAHGIKFILTFASLSFTLSARTSLHQRHMARVKMQTDLLTQRILKKSSKLHIFISSFVLFVV